MNKYYFIFFALLFYFFSGSCQVPQGINYQAVLRDNSGNILSMEAADVQFTIHQSTASGNPVYQEIHSTTTNDFGLFSLIIGNGSIVLGDFLTIDWLNDEFFLQIEFDGDQNGTYEIDLGTTQLISVPYALAADKAKVAETATDMTLDELIDVNTAVVTNGQVLQWNGLEWNPANSNIYTSGTGINIAGNVISATNLAGDVTGILPATTVVKIQGVPVVSQAPIQNDIFKFNGLNWEPSPDNNTTYTSGVGIGIAGTIISNTGDVDPSDDLTIATSFGGDVSGTYNVIQLGPSSVGATELANSSVTNSKLSNNSVDGTKIAIGGDATGDVLYFNGTDYVRLGIGTNNQVLKVSAGIPSWGADNNTTYTGGPGINVTGTVITNTGDTDASDDLTTSTSFGGDVSGTYNAIQLGPSSVGATELANDAITTLKVLNNAIDGTKIAMSGDMVGDILYFNGTDYVRLGIGTPGQFLTVSGGIPVWSADNNTTYTGGTGITVAGTIINSVWTQDGNDIYSNNTGNVGIGTNPPAKILHVVDVMRIEPRAASPSTPSRGDIYFDIGLNKLRVYDGTDWQNCW